MIDQIAAIVGPKNVLTGADAAPYGEDITGMWQATPAAVARPASTQEVSDLIKLANTLRLPVIPVGGRSGLTRGGIGDGVLILSFGRDPRDSPRSPHRRGRGRRDPLGHS